MTSKTKDQLSFIATIYDRNAANEGQHQHKFTFGAELLDVWSAAENLEEVMSLYTGTHVDYNAFKSDSAYNNAIDDYIADIEIESIEIEGPKSRYEVITQYDGSSCFTGFVFATDEDEAEFQARWISAKSRGYEAKIFKVNDFSLDMQEIDIASLDKVPFTLEEVAALLHTYMDGFENGKEGTPAHEEARAALIAFKSDYPVAAAVKANDANPSP